jgi:hypothetical protein
MQTRNQTTGRYARKGGKVGSLLKALYVAIVLAVILVMIFSKKGSKDAPTPSTSPVGDATFVQEATEDTRYQEYMNREEVKKAMELNAKIAVVEEDLEAQRKAKLEADAQLDAEYKAKKEELRKTDAVKMLNLNTKLDGLQKEKLQLVASSSKTSFKNTQVVALRHFLQTRNPEMAKYAHLIVELPRYMEVVALTGQESTWCTKGVGQSKNNCGAIRGGKDFKTYPNVYESLKDIARLLDTPAYKDKTIADWNGRYCVHEESSTGTGKCPNWTENITSNVVDIREELLSRI